MRRLDKKNNADVEQDVVKSEGGVQETPRQKLSIVQRIKQAIRNLLEHYFYGWMRYNIILTGKIPSFFLRRFIYKYVYCMNITRNTMINGGCEFRSPWNIQADRCIIMSNAILDGRAGIQIGQDVVFGNGVHIWTEEHDIQDPYFGVGPENRGCVVIDAHAWICSDSTILPKTRIGEGAVVAARACVTRDCEAFGVYGGVPAKKIGERENELRYQLGKKPHWSFY